MDDGPTLIPAPIRPRKVGAWERLPDGRWLHRPRCKVIVNTVLRWLQRGQPVRWVIYTRCDDTEDGSDNPPKVLGYGFGPVVHLPDGDGGRP